MAAVLHYGIAHSQLFKQASRPRLEVQNKCGRDAPNARNTIREGKLHTRPTRDPIASVGASCSCKGAKKDMRGVSFRGPVRLHAEPGTKEAGTGSAASAEDQGDEMDLDEDSESAQKLAEIERLRQAERFMVVGTGEATCMGCGYEYQPKNGDPEYPITPGTYFTSLPEDWYCPICGADKGKFQSKAKEIAGFAENQKYGLGTNSLTGGQKSLLIFGSLLAFFFLFLGGYFIS